MKTYSDKFKLWISDCMQTNGIETYSELASRIGVSRQTLHAWINDPTKLKKYCLAGIMHILNYRSATLDTLCYMFGIS